MDLRFMLQQKRILDRWIMSMEWYVTYYRQVPCPVVPRTVSPPPEANPCHSTVKTMGNTAHSGTGVLILPKFCTVLLSTRTIIIRIIQGSYGISGIIIEGCSTSSFTGKSIATRAKDYNRNVFL